MDLFSESLKVKKEIILPEYDPKNHKFNFRWTLKDAIFTKDKGKVFSCFSCGGGSTMGYKLAGFEVIGCNEIDKKMMEIYKENHHPKFSFLEGIQSFKNRTDLPDELYNLDILDGSPPCSSFSIAGNREKDWGKEKVFREGQSKQVLDTLFFDFIDLAKKLSPKIVIAENVKGLLLGSAKKYVKKIYDEFDKAGYYCQHFLLDSSKMGVPQKRERVFFICLRKDLAKQFLYEKSLFEFVPKLNLKFNEPKILYNNIFIGDGNNLTKHAKQAWDFRKFGDTSIIQCKKRAGMKESDYNNRIIYKHKVLPTVTGNGHYTFTLFDIPNYISDNELILAGSFPSDYNFLNINPGYVIGMSVPPVMIANIATKVYEQWLSKIV